MIVVNPTTRQFNIPGADLVFGVTDDSGAEVKHFQCPRLVGNNLDIASSFVRINYRNANGEIDSHLISDIATDGSNVTFSWELHPKVTRYKGNIAFVMCVVGPDTKVKWHTTLGRGQVLEGLEPDNAIIEAETEDAIAQLIAMVEAQTEAVEKTGADQVAVVKAAAKTAQDSAVAEIEAKRVNSLDSIPDDYTAMQTAVGSLTRGRAGAIVCEAAGSAVAVNDASDNYMQGLKIFGRSTQDGIPTPEAPVEIKSVESPLVVTGGKNFFDVSAEVVLYSLPVQTTKDGLITLDRTAGDIWGDWMPLVLKKGVPYTISVEFVEKETPSEGVTFRTSDTANKNGVDVTAIRLMYSIDGRVSYTFTPTKDTNYIQFYLQSSWSLDSKISFKNVQVETGSVATAYEPYKPIQTVETSHPLRGIPVTSGGNYTDENGQQWICDEVDLERGAYVRRVFEETVSAEKITQVDNAYVSMGGSLAYFTQTHPHLVNDNLSLVMSDVCVGIPYTKRRQEVDLYRCYAPSTGQNILVLRYPEAAGEKTVAEAKSEFAGAKVVYALATPIETTLSETEIAAYRALHSNYPNTTVLNDAGAHMSVKYAADTKLYIDNKIAALVGNI